MSFLEPGDYYILDASDKNFVALANNNNHENLTLQVNEPDRTIPNIIGREWKILPKMPGSDEYWIRNIKYNDTYATWAPFPRPNEVQGVWQRQDDLTRPQMLWKIKPDPTTGFYRIYPAIDDASFTACWNIVSSMQGNFVDISTPESGSDVNHSLWKFVEAEIPQAYVIEVDLPAFSRSPLNKLEVVFVQEIPSREPITSYMDKICRPLLQQKKIKNEDLIISLIECKIESSRTLCRYSASLQFDRLRGWLGVDFPWETTKLPPILAVLKALRRMQGKWTPGSLTVVVFDIFTLQFSDGPEAVFADIGGENGCILILLGNQHTTSRPAFQGLAHLSSGAVLSVPPSEIGDFMVKARETGDMVTLARTFPAARQWYPKAGRLLDIGMTAEELRDFERNPKAPTPAYDDYRIPPSSVGSSSRSPGRMRHVTFRNDTDSAIELSWATEGNEPPNASENKWNVPPHGSVSAPITENVPNGFLMISREMGINIFTRLFQDDTVVDLAAYYADAKEIDP